MLCWNEPSTSSRPLLEIAAAPDYFARVGEVVVKVETARDSDEAVELLECATRLLGADVAVFISFIRDNPDLESFRFLVACDAQWCAEYEQRAWYADDPWLNYARRHSEPTASLDQQPLTPAQQELLAMSGSYGFASTALIPAPSSGGLSRLGVLCVGSRTPGFFEGAGFTAFKIAARPLAAGLHEWWIARLGEQLMADARLAAQDLDLLRFESRGIGSKRISESTGDSISAIDSRFHRVISRMGVSSRAEAARLAAEYGLI